MKKIKFIQVFWLAFYILVLVLLLRGGFSYLDPDLGWHLRVGEEIAQTSSVPRINTFNFTYTGSWVDHEWLSNYLMYKININFGYTTLVYTFAFIIVLVLIILNVFTSKIFNKDTPFYIIASLQLAGVLAAMSHFGVRVQELSLLFLSLLLIIIYYYNESKNWQYLVMLAPLFFLWASMHASFLLGLALLFAWLIIKSIEPWLIKQQKYFFWLGDKKILKKPQVACFGLFSLVSLGATLITPYRLELYSFLSDYKNKAYLSLIQEWLPQHNFPFHYGQLLYMALAASVFVYLFYRALSCKKKIDLWYLFLSVLFLSLSWMSRRHFPLFFVVSFPVLATFYADLFYGTKVGVQGRYLGVVTLLSLFLVTSVQFLELRPISKPFTSYCNTYPCGALNFLKSHDKYLEGNLFNNYNWGGYLNYTLVDHKIFIDGRLPQVKLNGHTFIEEYYDFLKLDTDKDELLDRHRIQTVLIPASNKVVGVSSWEQYIFNINKSAVVYENYLREHLQAADNWGLVYSDPVAHIYHRVPLQD